jgi:hypothetical protein
MSPQREMASSPRRGAEDDVASISMSMAPRLLATRTEALGLESVASPAVPSWMSMPHFLVLNVTSAGVLCFLLPFLSGEGYLGSTKNVPDYVVKICLNVE